MNHSHKRDFLLDNICAGIRPLVIGGKTYLYKEPSLKTKVKANIVYEQAIADSEGLSKEDALLFIPEWSEALENEIRVDIPRVIDDLKVEIYYAYKADKRHAPPIEDKLSKVKEHLLKLLTIKHKFDEYTSEGLAEKERTLYLLRKGVKGLNNVEFALTPYYESAISDTQLRDLARSSEWLLKWTAFKAGRSPFSKTITEEQERLIYWTSLYENVIKEQDSPSDEIIAHDDAFDGFLVVRRRENDRLRGIDEIENKVGKKVAGCSEVFVIARDEQHAREINSRNTPEGAKLREKRIEMIKKMGSVDIGQFTDEKLKLQLAKNNLEINGGK